MRLFSRALSQLASTTEHTYFEVVKVEYGYCEAQNPYAINELKRLGFEEVKVEAAPVARPIVESIEQKPVKAEPKIVEPKVKPKIITHRPLKKNKVIRVKT